MPEAHVTDLHVGDEPRPARAVATTESGDLAQERRHSSPGTARIDRPLAGIVVLTLHGEHGDSTWPVVEHALSRAVAGSSLLVDLTHCTRIELAGITEIGRLRARGDSQPALDLVVPSYCSVADAWIDLIDGQATMIHRSRPHALAAMARR